MDEHVNLEDYLKRNIKESLENNQKSKFGIVGPSTLKYDHTPILFMEELSQTEAELYIFDIEPERLENEVFGNIRKFMEQVENLKKYKEDMKGPCYVIGDIYETAENHKDMFAMLLDHCTFEFIVNEKEDLWRFRKLVDRLLQTYMDMLTYGGKAILAFNTDVDSMDEFLKDRVSGWIIAEFLKKSKKDYKFYHISEEVDYSKLVPLYFGHVSHPANCLFEIRK